MYNPVILLAYQLDSKYRGKLLNANQCNSIIKHKILRLTPKDKKNEVLMEYSDYVRKFGRFSDDHLWGVITSHPINWWTLDARRYLILNAIVCQVLSILSTSAASERNWSSFGFIHSKLHNRLEDSKVEKCVYLYWNMRILKQIYQQEKAVDNADLSTVRMVKLSEERIEEVSYELLGNLNELLDNDILE